MKKLLHDFIQELSQQLTSLYSPEHAKTVALWLLETTTKKTHAQLLGLKHLELSDAEVALLQESIDKLVHKNYPLQYILGSVPFGPLDLVVAPPTLIPRPETEEWCAALLQELQLFAHLPLTILDMCTGSGCIGLWLAHALPKAQVYAVDISQQALELAKKNAEHNKIKNITFVESNLFANLQNLSFDCIISNPPYIANTEWVTLEPVVKNWEDKNALVADDDGLFLIKQIIKQAQSHLKKESVLKNNAPRIVLEIGATQGAAVKKLMEDAKFYNVICVVDYAQKERIVKGY